MSLYPFIVFIHIAAAAILVGGSVLAGPLVRAAARRTRATQDLRAFLTLAHTLEAVDPIVAMVVLASGVYLTSVSNFWTFGWVQVSTAFWMASSFVAVGVVKPLLGRLAAEAKAAADAQVSERLNALRWSARWTYGGDFLAATDAAVLYLMTMKPGLFCSLAVVAAAYILIFAVRLVVGRSRPVVAERSEPATVTAPR